MLVNIMNVREVEIGPVKTVTVGAGTAGSAQGFKRHIRIVSGRGDELTITLHGWNKKELENRK